MKDEVAVHIVDVSRGSRIFRYTPPGSRYIWIVAAAIEKVMDIKFAEEIVEVINRRVQIGQTYLYAIT